MHPSHSKIAYGISLSCQPTLSVSGVSILPICVHGGLSQSPKTNRDTPKTTEFPFVNVLRGLQFGSEKSVHTNAWKECYCTIHLLPPWGLLEIFKEKICQFNSSIPIPPVVISVRSTYTLDLEALSIRGFWPQPMPDLELGQYICLYMKQVQVSGSV